MSGCYHVSHVSWRPLFTWFSRWALVEEKVDRKRDPDLADQVLLPELRWGIKVWLNQVLDRQDMAHLRPRFSHLPLRPRWTLRSLEAHRKQNRIRNIPYTKTVHHIGKHKKCFEDLHTYRPACAEKLEERALLEEVKVRDECHHWNITDVYALLLVLIFDCISPCYFKQVTLVKAELIKMLFWLY